jgi:hypothetical protein
LLSQSFTARPFELLHYDLRTSPIPNTLGFGYYLVIIDDYSHYFWSFPLHKKSDVYRTFVAFHAFVTTRFNLPILTIQCDNGKEFDNIKLNTFFQTHSTIFRFSHRYTSQQNGKAERAIRTINDVIRSLLFQTSMPPNLWAEALTPPHISLTYVLRLPFTNTHHTSSYTTPTLPMIISVSSAVYAMLILPVHPPTN